MVIADYVAEQEDDLDIKKGEILQYINLWYDKQINNL